MFSPLYLGAMLAGKGVKTLIPIDGTINIVSISASIMDQSFTNEEEAARSFYTEGGLAVKVHNRAVSGDVIANTLAALPANLSEFAGQEENTIFLYHGPGNNVSNDGPYPGGAVEIEAGVRKVFEDILAAGFYCVASNITYRVPPASNPSEPYNINIIEPLIEEILPTWMGNTGPIVDMYQLYYDNQANIDPDGVHPDSILEKITTNYFAQKVGGAFSQINPPNITIKNIVVSCGGDYANPAIPNILAAYGSFSSPSNVGEAEGNLFGQISTLTSKRALSGRGNAGDTSESLTNDYLLTYYLYTDDDSVQTVDIDLGVDYADSYTVKVTASRDTTDTDRITDYTIGGVTKQIDAAANPPEIVAWTGVTGQQLLDNGIQWKRAVGSSFGYLNGFSIEKE